MTTCSDPGLLALRPSGDRQGQVDPDAARLSCLDNHVTESVASPLPSLRPAREPLRADLDDDVETADVVGRPRVEADLDITWLKHPVVGLFWAFGRKRDRMRQRLREPKKPLLRYFRPVGDIDDRHDNNVVGARGARGGMTRPTDNARIAATSGRLRTPGSGLM